MVWLNDAPVTVALEDVCNRCSPDAEVRGQLLISHAASQQPKFSYLGLSEPELARDRPDVHNVSNQLKVGRPNTVSSLAGMVPFHPIDRTANEKVMRSTCAPIPLEHAVTVTVDEASPTPASVGLINLGPEAIFSSEMRGVSFRGQSNCSIAVCQPTVIVQTTPTTSYRGAQTVSNGTLGLHRKVPSFGVVGRVAVTTPPLYFTTDAT